jgi:hypothetical protein
MITRFSGKWLLGLSILMLVGCIPSPPEHVDNVCKIFHQYPDWYWAARDTEKRWGVPVSGQMAIIHQESHFNAEARPPRGRLLWIIPWKRPSSAFGYSQALRGTWKSYKRDTGHFNAGRHEFDDASDFIGWYANYAHKKAGISKRNTYELYLAYHEGVGGYQKRTYLKKPWLVTVARKVSNQASIYQRQLNTCKSSLKEKPWYRIW